MKLGYVRTLINIEIIIIVLVFVPFLEFSMSLRSKQGRTQVDYDLTPIYFSPSGILARNTRAPVKIASRIESNTRREERNLSFLCTPVLFALGDFHARSHISLAQQFLDKLRAYLLSPMVIWGAFPLYSRFFSFLIAARNHSFLIYGEVSEVLLSATQVPL